MQSFSKEAWHASLLKRKGRKSSRTSNLSKSSGIRDPPPLFPTSDAATPTAGAASAAEPPPLPVAVQVGAESAAANTPSVEVLDQFDALSARIELIENQLQEKSLAFDALALRYQQQQDFHRDLIQLPDRASGDRGMLIRYPGQGLRSHQHWTGNAGRTAKAQKLSERRHKLHIRAVMSDYILGLNHILKPAFDGEVVVLEMAVVLRVTSAAAGGSRRDRDIALHVQPADPKPALHKRYTQPCNPIFKSDLAMDHHYEACLLAMLDAGLSYGNYAKLKVFFPSGSFRPSQYGLIAARERLLGELKAKGVYPLKYIYADDPAVQQAARASVPEAVSIPITRKRAHDSAADSGAQAGGEEVMQQPSTVEPAAQDSSVPAKRVKRRASMLQLVDEATAAPAGKVKIGCYVPVAELIAFCLPVVPESLKLFSAIPRADGEPIKLLWRVGADGRGFANELQTIGGFLRPFGSATTAFNEMPWFIIEGAESYSFMNNHLKPLFNSLAVLEKNTCHSEQIEYTVRFHLLSDYKMLCELLGNDEAKCKHFCFMCTADKETMRANAGSIIGLHCNCPIATSHLLTCSFYFTPKTLESMKDLLSHAEKDSRKGVSETPIWPFGPSPDRAFIDTLHWTMGLARCISDALLDKCQECYRKQLQDVFENAGVSIRWRMDAATKAETRSKLLGNEFNKVLNNLDVFEAHKVSGYDALKCDRAKGAWEIVRRLISAASSIPTETGSKWMEPSHFRLFADFAIHDIVLLYGKDYCAAYTHSTTDHMAAQLEYLQSLGPQFTLGKLGCQSLELRNQVLLLRILLRL